MPKRFGVHAEWKSELKKNLIVLTTFLFLFLDGRDHFPQGLQPLWVQELINESRNKKDVSQRIRSLPRTPDQLGYALDSSDFWSTFELYPEVPWVD